jgi:hypothetical protein
MKRLLILFSLISSITCSAQTLKKYNIGDSGCSLYNYCIPKFSVDFSDDSSKVYTGECAAGGVTYGVICIKLLTTVPDLTDAEELMINYLSYLKSSFQIIKSAGYGYGHHVKDREDTRGVIDYWTDNAGDQWKIKSYTDGKFIGFMYAYSSQALPEQKVNVFLDSFRLPIIK